MGVALTTITALYLKKVKDTEYVRVATFGSPKVLIFMVLKFIKTSWRKYN
ncbi:MAG: hypothetical protein ACR5K2_04875 [Wolbachia sp.]